ncbi:MAG TPA: hypothetical protein VFK11_01450 [Candidatus Saccharimonadales bacterium]|nr:hypothetical protein [Candidatus Saccharimonadales bacterium]
MALKLTGTLDSAHPERGWGIIGERLGDASTEVLKDVLPLEEEEKAKATAAELEEERAEGLSWYSSRVSLIGSRPEGEGGTAFVYVEASDLSHRLQDAA